MKTARSRIYSRRHLGRPPGTRLFRCSAVLDVLGPVIAVVLLACQDATLSTAPPEETALPFTFPAQFSLSPAGSPCSYGDATALFESLEAVVEIRVREGLNHPRVQPLIRCQFRLFWEAGNPFLGKPITFTREDFFLGGVAIRVPYIIRGLSMQQAQAVLDAVEVQVSWGKVVGATIGELVDIPLLTTTSKQTMTESLGLILWRQWGFISQSPPGEYVAVTKLKRPIFFEDEITWTVRVFIL